jgi:hypothetical protein
MSRKEKFLIVMNKLSSRYKGCVVVQGQSHPAIISQIKASWEGYQLIFSAWEGDDTSGYSEGDIVLLNKMPEERGVQNLNLQKISTINGLSTAKELGWKRALKIRSDMWVNNADGVMGLFKHKKLNLYGWQVHRDGYIMDFFMEGECDDIITLFDVPPTGPYPEYNLTKQLYNSGLNRKVHMVCRDISDSANIYWWKHSYWMGVNAVQSQYSTKLPSVWNG